MDTCGPNMPPQRLRRWRCDLIPFAAPRLIPEEPVPLPAWRGTRHKGERKGAPIMTLAKLPMPPPLLLLKLEEYKRVFKEALDEARELLELLDADDMPALARRLRQTPLRNPYTLQTLADLSERRGHRRSGKQGGDSRHAQRNRPNKQAALAWFESVRETQERPDGLKKNAAAELIADKFHVSKRTARDWLKGK